MKDYFIKMWQLGLREIRLFGKRPMFLCCMLLVPLVSIFFFPGLMKSGLPTELPCGLVDEDNTATTRSIVRILNSMQYTDLGHKYANFHDARKAVQRGEIYGFFYVPRGVTDDALASRQPKISFYTNDSYYIAGSLLMKDLKVVSELAGMAVTKSTLTAKGIPESMLMGIVQPIVIETHCISNPYLNYSVYLSNLIIPGMIFLLAMLFTSYTLGLEWKNNTVKEYYELADGSITVALVGKLWPQTLLFSMMIVLADTVFYRYLGYPCQVPVIRMIAFGILGVIASESIAIFFYGTFRQMRMSMSASSLFAVVQFSMCGFTFPATAMSPVLQLLGNIFPLRHYYLIYCNQALNGYNLAYVWPSIVALLVMLLLPPMVIKSMRYAMLNIEYKP